MSARLILKGIGLAALGVAGYWSVRLAWADWRFRENTFESVQRASELDSENARYHAWLAEFEEYEGLDPSWELARASELNPNDSAIWIRRGLHAETKGDFAQAESFLLKAAAIDKLYAPRWALANYYARRGDTERMWPWVRQALEMSYDDSSALFRLCWSVSSDAELIRARAIPARTDVLGKYLAFLTRENLLDAAEPIARDYLAHASNPQAGLNYCDRLIEHGKAHAAVTVWNALCERRIVPFAPLTAENVLTNGMFTTEPLQQGFDWRISGEPEISVTRTEGLRFHLSGKQPEHCELLAQIVPLAAGRTYRFRSEYKATVGPGMRWRVGELARSPEIGRGDWGAVEVTFTPESVSLARLALVYDRAPGSVRAEGDVWLRNATISVAP